MTNNKQQTAVEWLENQLKDYIGGIFTDTFEQAKEMEKEKLEDAWVEGFKNWNPSKTFEDYYNETYGGGDK
jgi:hypothetical protein